MFHHSCADYNNPKYLHVLEMIIAACEEFGVAPGIYFAPPGLAPERLLEMGFKVVTMPWVGWAREGIKGGLAKL